jgi:hypothetical protein
VRGEDDMNTKIVPSDAAIARQAKILVIRKLVARPSLNKAGQIIGLH